MIKCFLHGYGRCGSKITGEHYLSETVLQAIGRDGNIVIGGLPWQPRGTLQSFGINSLVANILCDKHNPRLSPLDTAAGKLFRSIDSADKRPATLSSLTTVDGTHIERWFLKVICGLAAGVRFNNSKVPDTWKHVLSGEPWPDGWGLYRPDTSEPQVLAPEFYLETHIDPTTKELLAMKFHFAGIHFNLMLRRPDNPAGWGTYRPRGLIIRDGTSEKRVEFKWPFDTNEAVIYSKVGTTASVPQWNGWKEC